MQSKMFPPKLPSRSRRAARAALFAPMIAFTAVIALPSAAQAEDDFFYACASADVHCQNGIRVDPPTLVDRCEKADDAHHDTWVCIRRDGDYVFVYDGRSDGHSALARVDSPSLTRYCRNRHGKGTWARCNFDWTEGASLEVAGGYLVDYRTRHLQVLFNLG